MNTVRDVHVGKLTINCGTTIELRIRIVKFIVKTTTESIRKSINYPILEHKFRLT